MLSCSLPVRACVCLCVFPPAWQSQFLETGWTLYTEMAIASTIHTIIQLIHTLAAVIVFPLCVPCVSGSWNGNRCDYDAAMKWLFQHAASIKFSGFGRTHPVCISLPWSAFINTSVFLSCQHSVNGKGNGQLNLVTRDILALMWKWVLLAKNKCWGFLLGWLRQNQISVILWDISGHRVWKKCCF